MYSNPPLHGAMLVKEILGEEGLKQRCAPLSDILQMQGMPGMLGMRLPNREHLCLPVCCRRDGSEVAEAGA
jgi:hypothetical protein